MANVPEVIKGNKTFNNNVVVRGEMWVEKLIAKNITVTIPLATDAIIGGMKINASTTPFYLDGTGTLQTTQVTGGDMLSTNNLSDVASVSISRDNLNVYSKSDVYTKSEADSLFLTSSSNAIITGSWTFSNTTSLQQWKFQDSNKLNIIDNTTGWLNYRSNDNTAKSNLIISRGLGVSNDTNRIADFTGSTGQVRLFYGGSQKIETESFGASIIGNTTGNANRSYISFRDSSDSQEGFIGIASTWNRYMYLNSDVSNILLRANGGGNHIFGSNLVQLNGETATAGTLAIRQKGNTNNDGIYLYNGNGNSCRIYHDASNDFVFARSASPYFKLTTTGQLVTNNFTNTSFTGAGISLDQDGLISCDSLSVRGTFKAYAFEVDEIRANNGSLWISNGAKFSQDADATYIYLAEETCNPSPFISGDICQVQTWDKQNNTIKKVVIKVNDNGTVSGTNIRHTYEVLDGVYTDLKDGDSVVRIDSTIASRRNSLYLTASDNNSPFMDAVRGNGNGVFTSFLRVGELSGLPGQSGAGIWATSLAEVERTTSNTTYNSTDLTITDGVIEKTEVASGWGNYTYSNETYTSGAEVKWIAKTDATTTYPAIMCGLDSGTPTQYNHIDYAIYQDNTTVRVYESGTNIGSYGSYVAGDELRIVYSGTTVTYYKNGEVLRTVSTTAGRTFRMGTDMYYLGNKIAPVFSGNTQSFVLSSDGYAKIAGWNFNKQSIYTGTEFGTASSDMTFSVKSGDYRIKSENFSVHSDGTVIVTGQINVTGGDVITKMSYEGIKAKIGASKLITVDPTFIEGTNSTSIYNNAGGSTSTWTRVSADSDNPTGSSYQMKYSYNGGGSTSPGYGGFYWGSAGALNREYIVRIVAKIPVDYKIHFASNSTATGSTTVWLTSQAGTGKYEEYIHYVKYGYTGTPSSTNFFYFSGADAAFDVNVIFAAVYDATADAEIPKLHNFANITNNQFEIQYDANNYVRLYRNSGTDYGLKLVQGGTTYAQLGSTNQIAGWNFDNEAIWTGTKKTTDGFTTGGITLSTVGNGSLRAPKFELRSNGDAYFSGVLSAASGSFSGSITSTSGNIGGWEISSDRIQRIINGAGITLRSDLGAIGVASTSGNARGIEFTYVSGSTQTLLGNLSSIQAFDGTRYLTMSAPVAFAFKTDNIAFYSTTGTGLEYGQGYLFINRLNSSSIRFSSPTNLEVSSSGELSLTGSSISVTGTSRFFAGSELYHTGRRSISTSNISTANSSVANYDVIFYNGNAGVTFNPTTTGVSNGKRICIINGRTSDGDIIISGKRGTYGLRRQEATTLVYYGGSWYNEYIP